MNPSRRKLLYRLGAAKQEVAVTVAPVVAEVKQVAAELKVEKALPIAEEVVIAQDTAEVAEVQEEVATEVLAPIAGKKTKKSV